MAEAEAMQDMRNEDMSNVDMWIWKCMDVSCGPEMCGSEPSTLPHLTMSSMAALREFSGGPTVILVRGSVRA
jgi:hypothetical protein